MPLVGEVGGGHTKGLGVQQGNGDFSVTPVRNLILPTLLSSAPKPQGRGFVPRPQTQTAEPRLSPKLTEPLCNHD